MDANELRINNYLQSTLTGQVFKVTAEDIVNIKKDNSVAESIQITEAWLLKFGFEKLTSSVFERGRFHLKYLPQYNFWYVNDALTGAYYSKVESVHELQNLVWGMDQQELTIKDTDQ